MMRWKAILIIAIPLIIIVSFFGIKYLNDNTSNPELVRLSDNVTVLQLIKNDKNVTYSNIKLYKTEDSFLWSIHFPPNDRYWPGYQGPDEYTKYIRVFEAYKYPLDLTPLKENRKIIGFVDSNLKVWTWAELRGDSGII